MKKRIEHPQWFFMWAAPKGKEYITTVCGWTRTAVKDGMERENGEPWKAISARGGRIVRVKIVIVTASASRSE